MIPIGRMDAHACERRSGELTGQHAVPRQAGRAPPATPHTVNKRSCVKIVAGAKVAHPSQPGRVFHFCVGRGPLSGSTEEPGWSNETSRRKPRPDKFFSRLGDSAKGFIVIEVVKFPFVAGIQAGEEFLRQVFILPPRPLMKITVDHDLVSLPFQILKPANEGAIFRERAAMVIVRHHEQRANRNPMMRKVRQNCFHYKSSRRRNVMHGNDQSFPIRFRRKSEDGGQRCRSGAGHAGFSIPSGTQTSLIGW